MSLEDYFSSFSKYIDLLKSPRLDSPMFKCDNSMTWKDKFQAWNVVYCFGQLATCILYLLVKILSSHVKDLFSSVYASLSFAVCNLVVAHLGWYCIVLQNGCCGPIGYLLWAIVYTLAFVMRFGIDINDLYNLIYTLLLVPLFYMMYACWQLYSDSGGFKKKRGAKVVKSEPENRTPATDAQVPLAAVHAPAFQMASPGAPVPTQAYALPMAYAPAPAHYVVARPPTSAGVLAQPAPVMQPYALPVAHQLQPQAPMMVLPQTLTAPQTFAPQPSQLASANA